MTVNWLVVLELGAAFAIGSELLKDLKEGLCVVPTEPVVVDHSRLVGCQLSTRTGARATLIWP